MRKRMFYKHTEVIMLLLCAFSLGLGADQYSKKGWTPKLDFLYQESLASGVGINYSYFAIGDAVAFTSCYLIPRYRFSEK